MKSFNTYINEELEKTPTWIDVTVGMFKNASDISKDTVINMLFYLCECGKIKKLSDYFLKENQKDYIQFQPSDDDFLKEDSKSKICSDIAEYIIKFISKRN